MISSSLIPSTYHYDGTIKQEKNYIKIHDLTFIHLAKVMSIMWASYEIISLCIKSNSAQRQGIEWESICNTLSTKRLIARIYKEL